MKAWLGTFSAALLAVLIGGALLLGWQRRVAHWESGAAVLLAQADQCLHAYRASGDAQQTLWRARVVKSQLNLVRLHLGQAPTGAQADSLRAARDALDRTVGEYLAEHPAADLDAVSDGSG